MTDQVVTLRIMGDGRAAVTAVSQVGRGLEGLGETSDRASSRASSGMNRTKRSAVSLQSVVGRLRMEVAGFFGAFASVQGIRALAGIADRYANITSQLKLATNGQTEFARAESETFAISQRTSTALASTAELYARITRATAEYNVGQERVLGLTETINQTFAVSGTAATAQANAITQLTQAFAGGVLRAEEFNSIIENSPRLAQVFADGIDAAGGSVGKLRQLVNDGKIDVDSMVRALENQAKRVAEEFEKMPLTIERAWIRITNAITSYIGRADQANGASRDVADAMAWVADNIDRIIGGAVTLAKVLITIYGTKLLMGAAAYTAELVRQVALQLAAASAARDMGIKIDNGLGASIKKIGALNVALGAVGAGIAGWQIGTYLRNEFRIVADAGDYLVYGIAQSWEKLKQVTKIAWEAIKFAAVGAIDLILESFAGMLRGMAKLASVEIRGEKIFGGTAEGLGALANEISGVLTPLSDYEAAIKAINTAHEEGSGENKKMLADLQSATAATFAAKDATTGLGGALNDTATGGTNAGKGLSEAAKAAREFVKGAQDRVAELAKEVATFGKSEGAVLQYDAANKKLTATQRQRIAAAAGAIDALNAEKKSLEDSKRALESLASMNADLDEKLVQLADEISGADSAQMAFNETMRAATKEYEAAGGALNPDAVKAYTTAHEKAQRVMEDTRGIERQTEALREMEKQIQEAQRWWEDFTGDLADAILDGSQGVKRWWKQMLDDMKRQLIQSGLLKLFGSIFGGGGGGGGWGGLISAGLAAAVGGGSSSASASGALVNTGVNSALYNSGVSLFDPSSWVTAGKSLWNGFAGAQSATANSTIFGSYSGAMPGSAMTSPWSTGASPWSTTGGQGMTVGPGSYQYAPSTFGYVAAGAAGAYAGWQRWQGSNKDAGGALGAAAYGVGTYSAAIGVGAAATGGLAVGLAAIPVVGWIALAAMAVDMLSGGKLFGTKGKLHHSNLSLDVGAEGVDLAQSYTLKGQKAFFGGTKWTTKNVTPDAESVAAAQAFYQALLDNRTEFAKAFNAETGALIGGSWAAEYDKKGNITSQSATVMGVEYKDADQEAFGRILIAENMIDVLTQFDDQVSVLAENVRGDVEALEAYANQYANAIGMVNAAIEGGMASLALGSELSVQSFMDLAREMANAGETIEQTVQRLLEAQAQYDQFIAQFQPGPVYVNDFEAALSHVFTQMQANIAQANALARAAGAEGAATEDLVAIHAYAARQFATLLAQLESAAQDAAFGLGLTDIGSYDAITAEIERLQARAGAAEQPIRNFGSAIESAAQRASDAINLLLGDLSPLNDLEKLEVARGGLMQGSVTQEQFLQIARRLFGSSMQYEQEFSFAQRYGGRGAAADASSSYGGSGSAAQGLTTEERERLARLLEMQQEAQAQQQLLQYQSFTAQLAEISAAREEDWTSVAERMGIDVEKLIAGLGLQSEEELGDLIEHYQEQLDSEERNTTRIVDELRAIRAALERDEQRRETGRDDIVVRPPTGPGGREPISGGDLREAVADGVERGYERSAGRYIGRGRQQQVRA